MAVMLLGAIAAALVAFLAAVPATRLSIRLARRGEVLDVANARSSHELPTPRLGGIGVMAGLVVVGAVLAAYPSYGEAPGGGAALPLLPVLGAALTVIAAFLVGLVDDMKSIAPLPKFLALLGVSAVAPAFGLVPQAFQEPFAAFGEVGARVAAALAAGIVVLVMMNMVNFMDGINGMAGRIAQFAAAGFVLGQCGHPGFGAWCAVAAALGGAATGFLRFNLGRADTFLGDCGSHAIGATIGVLALAVASLPRESATPFMVHVLLVFPPLFDIGFTMLRRARRGEAVWRPHRTNLYQRHHQATGRDHARTLDWYTPYLATAALLSLALARISEYLLLPWAISALAMVSCTIIAARMLREVEAAERVAQS